MRFLWLLKQTAPVAILFAADIAGPNIANNNAITAITTSNSIRVKPKDTAVVFELRLPSELFLLDLIYLPMQFPTITPATLHLVTGFVEARSAKC